MSEPERLQSAADVEPLWEKSHQVPVVIFKHSLTCPISRRAYREWERFLKERPADDPTVPVLVEIQNARPASKAVAQRSGIRHESPQALVVRDGEVVWHASHGAIRAEKLHRAVEAS
jgi:bacillithiol system protein YtxJ